MTLASIFDRLWSEYTQQNPSVGKVYDLFTSEGETVYNDHIAFRTFNDARIDVERLSQVFTSRGYNQKGEYRFDSKKLTAKHYEHETDSSMPRIFISQLILEECSKYLQGIIRPLIDQIPESTLASEDLGFCGRPWETPSFGTYEKLRQESEYAAWLYVNGFAVNHFTVSVNALVKYPGIGEVNAFLKQNGFIINDSGGEVKGGPGQYLEQSSTKAGLVRFGFREGVHEIPGCYYEFAKRYALPNGKLFSGFIANSADKIFESTDFYQAGS